MLRTHLIKKVYKPLIIVLILSFVSACTNGKRTFKQVDHDGDGRFEQQVTNTEKLSQRTLRLQEKRILANGLCSLQSNNHNEQRLVVSSSPLVIVDGSAITIPEEAQTKFYNPSIPPFNMPGCIAEALRWGGERLLAKVIDAGRDLLTLGIKGAAAYKIAKEVTDNSGVKVNGVEAGASVAVGTENAPAAIDNRDLSDNRSGQTGDGSQYGDCAGEVIDGFCVVPSLDEEAAPEELLVF